MQKMTSFRFSYDDMKWIHIDKNLAELVIAELMDEPIDCWADELPTCWSWVRDLSRLVKIPAVKFQLYN
jgi:hypothetical protein